MKVYVIMENYDYECNNIVSILTDGAKANEIVIRLNNAYSSMSHDFTLDEWDVDDMQQISLRLPQG